jgi:3-hydroxyisobutyrate dehydrogenase-like beta-hydroxyacid dehydrogenase
MRVGFIGLGAMGQTMAQHLVKAGHEVRVWNRTPARARPLVAAGATLAKTVAAACDEAAVVFSMLADDAALIDAVSGGDNEPGIIDALGEGDVHVSLATIGTELSARLTQAHAESGQHFVAAPVFGRPEAATAARLTIVAAGDDAALARVQPLLEVMGQKVILLGADPPAASLVKLTGNFLIASMIEALAEAYALLRRNGIDPKQFLEIVNGNLFRSPIYEGYGTLMAERQFTPPGFKLALGLKDVRLLLASADRAAVPMPLGSLVYEHLLSAVARGKGDLDWTALALVVAEDAGIADG